MKIGTYIPNNGYAFPLPAFTTYVYLDDSGNPTGLVDLVYPDVIPMVSHEGKVGMNYAKNVPIGSGVGAFNESYVIEETPINEFNDGE